MKIPIDCPICGDTLLTTYDPLLNGLERLTKTCKSKLNHILEFKAYDNSHDIVQSVIARFNDLTAIWMWNNNVNNTIWLHNKGKIGHTKIPFFEPDFSDYQKLIQKLKTYQTFL